MTISEVQTELKETERKVFELIQNLEAKVDMKVNAIHVIRPRKGLGETEKREPSLVVELENPFARNQAMFAMAI